MAFFCKTNLSSFSPEFMVIKGKMSANNPLIRLAISCGGWVFINGGVGFHPLDSN